MHLAAPIFLAYGDDSIWDIVVFAIAGAIWLASQMAAAKKKKEKKARPPPPSSAARSGGGDSPTPDELAEIFKRLGADIPSTPPPPRPHSAPPPPPPQLARRPAQKITPRKPAAERIQPVLARRLAQAKKDAAEAADLAESARIALNAIVPGVQSRAGETRALDTATRHTGAILPRLYAMSMRLAPLPALPMPGLDRTHHANPPMRTRLHTRREVRDALIAQTFLQPPRSLAR
ncbi:MAG: hypothetical protein EOM72_06780 [Opitutae bacterium]|nr:hypothetical protein [Opitutae bacterium]